MSRILGVDLGSRRIGLALSDPSGTLASPLSVLARSGDRSRDHQTIIATARENEADRIVVGMPRALSGKQGPAARSALEEIEQLRAAAPDDITIDQYDERFTTVIAERSLVQSGMRRDGRRQVVDKVAAAIMLQGYLEARA
ncbi:MAG: Holliday junction resolvase RuvX [Acidimicrobiia bacterium]